MDDTLDGLKIKPNRNSFVDKTQLNDHLVIYDYKSDSNKSFYDLYNGNNFDFKIYSQAPAEIMNVYQKLILNSNWDARECGDYQTIILGRNHMFYSLPQSETIEASQDKTEKVIVDPIGNFSLSFLNKVNDININKLDASSIYDIGTTYYYKKEEKEENYSSDEFHKDSLNKLLNRKNCRKYSERHFAVSGFNLVTHSISVNTEIPNTATCVAEKMGKDQRNSVSIIPDVDEKYVREIAVEPLIDPVSLADDFTVIGNSVNRARNSEFLANKLLEEVKYVYQGSIIIKFNANIEIGDTIALIDNVNSVYGIFEVDSCEHVLDQRGLLTNLIVKASWEIKDPLLDMHSKEIGYKLIDSFFRESGKEDNKLSYIASLYLKYLVQGPKYTNFYKKKKESIFNSSTIEWENKATPTSNMLRFYPMFVKGKVQIPSNLEPAFVYATSSNYFQSVISEVYKNISVMAQRFYNVVKKESFKFLIFTLDMLFSTITMNASEFFKPLLGMTAEKARKGTYDESKEADYDEFKEIMRFTPYDERYHLMYDYDFTIGFFNSRCMDIDSLYEGEEDKTKSTERTEELFNNKLKVMQKLANNLFDFMCIVELYDSFKFEAYGKEQNHEVFFENILIDYNQTGQLAKINTNSHGTEYAGLIAREKCFENNILKVDDNNNFTYKTIPLKDNRNAVEVEFDISHLEIDKIKTLKVVFLHNYYGNIDKEHSDVYQERRDNVIHIIDQYKKYSETEETAVAIIGDFNLFIYNSPNKPHGSLATDINETLELTEHHKFKAKITRKTTLKKNGYEYSKPFDNVLLSNNIADKVDAKAYVYPEENKLSISDHIPVYLGLKKQG